MVDIKSEELVRKRFLQFQQLQKNIESISEHVQRLNQRSYEIEESKKALEELAGVKEGSEIFAPIADGVFIKVALNDNKNLLLNAGADTVVERNIPDVVKLLAEQEDGLHTKMVEAQALLQELQMQAMKIYQEVEESL